MERWEIGENTFMRVVDSDTKDFFSKKKKTDKVIELLGQEYDSCNWEHGGVFILGLLGAVWVAFSNLYAGCFCGRLGKKPAYEGFDDISRVLVMSQSHGWGWQLCSTWSTRLLWRWVYYLHGGWGGQFSSWAPQLFNRIWQLNISRRCNMESQIFSFGKYV